MSGLTVTGGSYSLSAYAAAERQRMQDTTVRTQAQSAPAQTVQSPTTAVVRAAQTPSGSVPQSPAASDETAQTAAPAEAQTASIFSEPKEEPKTILEAMQEAREKAEERRKKFQLPKNTNYGDAAMMAYAKLQRARTPSEAGAAGGYARRRISQLKAAKRQDPEHAQQIQAAINQLEKAAGRASRKKRELTREHQMEVRRRKLQQEQQRRKAARLRQQLQRARTQRTLRESGYFREAEIANRHAMMIDATAAELREQFQTLSTAATATTDAAIQQYAAQSAAGAAVPPAPVISAEA